MQNSQTAMPGFGARPLFHLFLTLGILTAAALCGDNPAQAKTPGATYCFYKTCHRVKTIAETRALVGKEHSLPASFYDDCKSDRYNPCGLTSSGEVFRPNAPDNAASSIYPDGTKLLVWSPQTGQAIVLRINNAGPYWGNRTLDVSRAAAETLGFKKRGVATLKASILEAPTKAEATYKKGRTYAPVAGDIGRFASAGAAQAAMTSVQMIASATLAPFNGSKLPSALAVDVLPSSAIAIAALPSRPKLPDDAIADAKALVAFAWPVVGKTQAKAKLVALAEVAEADVEPIKTAKRYAPKRGESWSQRVTKARLKDVPIEKLNHPATKRGAGPRAAEVRRVKTAKALVRVSPQSKPLLSKSSANKSAVKVERKPGQKQPAVRLASSSRDKANASGTVFVIKSASSAAPSHGKPAGLPVVSQPNSGASKAKVKQAAAKPVLKTSALSPAKAKQPRPS